MYQKYMNFWVAFAAILLLTIWVIAGGFVTQASTLFHEPRNFNDYSHRAYWYTFWAAFVTWTLVGIALIAAFLSMFGIFEIFSIGSVAQVLNPNSKARGVSFGTVILLLVCLALVTTTGVLSALAAYNIKASNLITENTPQLQKGYDDCVIAAVMSLSAAGLLVIIFIAYIIVSQVRKGKEQKIIDRKRREVEKERKERVKERQQERLLREAVIERLSR